MLRRVKRKIKNLLGLNDDFNEQYVQKIMEATGWSRRKTISMLIDARKRMKISSKDYYKHKFFNVPIEEQGEKYRRVRRAEKRKEKREKFKDKNKKYVEQVMKATGWGYDEAILAMNKSKEEVGATYENFWIYKFWEIDLEEQKTYFTKRYRNMLREKYKDPDLVRIIANKESSNEYLKDYINREWCSNKDVSYNNFVKKFKDSKKIFYKPKKLYHGLGAEVIEINDENIKEVYEKIKKYPDGVIEEFVFQHPDLQEMAPSAANTMRVISLSSDKPLCEGGEKVDILFAILKLSGKDTVVDNFSGGGLVAGVDLETGKLITNAVNKDGEVVVKHPVSGKTIKGFQIPKFDEVKNMVYRACEEKGLKGYLGWDIAITEKGPVVIEVNGRPGENSIQSPFVEERKGLKEVVEKYLPENLENILRQIMKKTGRDYNTTVEKFEEAQEKLGISPEEYLEFRMYKVSSDRLEEVYAKRIRDKERKEKNIQKVMEKTGWDHDYAKAQVEFAWKTYGLRSRMYPKFNFEETVENSTHKKSAENRVLVLARNYTNAIGVIRALGEEGYKIDLIASANRKNKSRYIAESKYLDSCIEVVSKKTASDDDFGVLREMLKYANQYDGKVVLLPTDDYTTAVADKYREGLEKKFIMPSITAKDAGQIVKLMNKRTQARLANKAGLLTPKTWKISLGEEIKIPEDMVYPCFCKPISSISGYKTEMAKCINQQELEEHLRLLKEKNSERDFLVQEFLTIDEELDVSGVCMDETIFMPAVIRAKEIASYDKGVMITGELLPISEIESVVDNIREMLRGLHYHGIFSVQLCKANGQFYFIELNLRTVGYNYAYYASGVNLPKLYVKAILGEKTDFENEKIKEFGKTFAYEQVAWDDYLRGIITKKELREYVDNADINLLFNGADPRPGELFEKQYGRKVEREIQKKQKRTDVKAQIKRHMIAQEVATDKMPEVATMNLDKKEFEKTSEQFKYDDEKNKIIDIAKKKQPKPIIAACYHLGCPLPSNASLKYQPSVYLPKLEGTLEDLQERMGESVFPNTLNIRKEFRNFKAKFVDSTLAYTDTDLEVFFVDYMLYCKDYGFNIDDYFDYEFCNKEIETRETFLNNGYRKYVRQICNKDIQLFANKANFNDFFKSNVKREYCDVNTVDFETFKKFVSKYDRLFAKPVAGSGGAGACVLEIDHDGDMKEFYEYCRNNEYIIEEIVKQHKDLSKFNLDTLNTMRIYSLVDKDNKARIMGAIIRFGIAGQCVDNFHVGGFVSAIDIEKGEICTKGINRRGEFSEKHPDSNMAFLGTKVPEWDKVRKAVEDNAINCSHLNRHVGWDVAVTDKGEVELIEGNSRPNFDILQKVDMIGKFDIYEKYMPDLAKIENRPEFKNIHVEIDTANMENPAVEWK